MYTIRYEVFNRDVGGKNSVEIKGVSSKILAEQTLLSIAVSNANFAGGGVASGKATPNKKGGK